MLLKDTVEKINDLEIESNVKSNFEKSRVSLNGRWIYNITLNVHGIIIIIIFAYFHIKQTKVAIDAYNDGSERNKFLPTLCIRKEKEKEKEK